MRKWLFFIILSLKLTSGFAQTGLTKIIFFGDSLTDNGNLFRYTLHIIPKSPPYFQGRFSNGYTWADLLNTALQTKYGIETENYAVGGATAVLRNPSHGALPLTLGEEIDDYLLRHINTDKKTTVYAIWIGSNDFLDELKPPIDALSTEVVASIITNVKSLINHGAEHVFVINWPDFSQLPYVKEAELRDRLRALSLLANEKLALAIDELKRENPSKTIFMVNIYDWFIDILANPQKYNEQYNLNLQNTTESCWLGKYTIRNNKHNANASLNEAVRISNLYKNNVLPCEQPDTYVFWDRLHPSAVIHQLIEQQVELSLSNAEKLG